MNIKDKSLALAELMGWERTSPDHEGICTCDMGNVYNNLCCPYTLSITGLAQFAAILLKFPEVMAGFDMHVWQHSDDKTTCCMCGTAYVKGESIYCKLPTQANILDEILRMNGVEI